MYAVIAPAPPVVQHATIGMMEMIIVLIIIVILFGAGRLPQLGDALGKSIKNFKRGLNAHDEIDVSPKPKEIAEAPARKSVADEIAEEEARAAAASLRLAELKKSQAKE